MKGVENWFWIIFGILAGSILIIGIMRSYMGIANDYERRSQIGNAQKMASYISVLCPSPPESSDTFSIFLSDQTFAIYVSNETSKPPVYSRRLMERGVTSEGDYLCIQLNPVLSSKPICTKLCRMNMSYIMPLRKETIWSKVWKLLGVNSHDEWNITAKKLPDKVLIKACPRGEQC